MSYHTASATRHPIPGWELEKVKSPQEVNNFECYVPEGRSYPAWVELEKIVGTSTEHFTDGSWVDMLASLQKKNSDEQYVEWGKTNLDHSEASSYRPSNFALRRDVITVRQYGEEHFLLESGNHRICHAKFAGVRSLRVQLERCFYKPNSDGSSPVGAPVSVAPFLDRWPWLQSLVRKLNESFSNMALVKSLVQKFGPKVNWRACQPPLLYEDSY